MNFPEGHRERLRQKYRQYPDSLTEAEYLELLLTYVIPRRDVSQIASDLLSRFGSVNTTLCASEQDLTQVEGIGESTITFLKLIHHLMDEKSDYMTSKNPLSDDPPQLNLFELGMDVDKEVPNIAKNKKKSPKGRQQEQPERVFAEDEIANVLSLLPKVSQYKTIDAFKQFLNDTLPYNSADTRQRRSSYILNRFYPDNDLDTPLTIFLAHHNSQADLKPVIFYQTLNAEPIAALVADELIWPSLPMGVVNRARIRELLLLHRPNLKEASLAKILHSIFNTYSLTGIATANGSSLQFQLKSGTLESFLYVLTGEYPMPGIYSFESLFNGPLHHWMLWDRDWIRRQLYNLQDFGIVAKISEIDTVRQFTLNMDQTSALEKYYMHPDRNHLAVRETSDS